MNNPRQTVSDALVAFVRDKAKFKWNYVQLGGSDWDKLPNGSQPCCYILKVAEDITQERVFGAAKYRLHYKILCYFRGDAQPDQAPESIYNPALDDFDTIFKSKPPGLAQTLGGLVAHCWIEGATLIAGGILDPQIVVSVPVIILTGD